MAVADSGTLSVTSQGIVFAGSRTALEFPLDKLIGIRAFSDAIGLQIANRATEPIFRLPAGALAAATIYAVVAKRAEPSLADSESQASDDHS
jgi:hypothetical protein